MVAVEASGVHYDSYYDYVHFVCIPTQTDYHTGE